MTSTMPAPADAVRAQLTWQLPAYAGHWLSADDLSAVVAWMADNDLEDATAQAPLEVVDGRITYGQDRSPDTVRAAHRKIATVTVPLRTPPPTIAKPPCSTAELAKLQAVLAHHEWSAGFDGVCVDCSATQFDAHGRVYCHRDDVVTWPCPPVRAALATAGFHVPAGPAERILGDCLDPVDNARAGLATNAVTNVGT